MRPPAIVHVEDLEGLPVTWERTDEWYNFRSNPRDHVHVLATVDETSYSGGKMGADHPIAWCHEIDGGRSWYTAMGHTKIQRWGRRAADGASHSAGFGARDAADP